MKMITGHVNDLPAYPVPADHADNTVRRVVFSPDNCWDTSVMRVFTMERGGGTHEHEHPWSHWVFILEGKGIIVYEGKDYPVEAGSYMFIPGGNKHYLYNAGSGDEVFRFMCIVPPEGDTF
ncbi:MAG TPA: cupin domain-containing protein [Firmicutes bacterium]|jgi:quercetin dioxygenase-like cupin family protein|nr:cupin domain-containing protein [Bacillota bacterium]